MPCRSSLGSLSWSSTRRPIITSWPLLCLPSAHSWLFLHTWHFSVWSRRSGQVSPWPSLPICLIFSVSYIEHCFPNLLEGRVLWPVHTLWLLPSVLSCCLSLWTTVAFFAQRYERGSAPLPCKCLSDFHWTEKILAGLCHRSWALFDCFLVCVMRICQRKWWYAHGLIFIPNTQRRPMIDVTSKISEGFWRKAGGERKALC